MSYILYASIARAGGLDLYLGTEAVSHPPLHPHVRRRGPGVRLRLRRALGRTFGIGLVSLGRTLTRWGAKWAPVAKSEGLAQLKAAQ